MASAGPALRCKGLTKRYADVVAVDGLDLEVRTGECFGLLGPNGAGKTTTIEILEGLLSPDAGEVEVLGMRWDRDEARLRQRLGIQLQETQLNDKLSVRETLGLFRSFYTQGPTVDHVMASVGLDSKQHAWYSKLSGGRLGYAVLVGDALRDARRHGMADPIGALTEQMLVGSPLERRLRLSYEVRLQRARGYGALRAILDVLAEQQPLTLTQIAQRLHRTPGSTKDYLSWMLDVDLLAVERKRYSVADPLLRLWIRLNNGVQSPGDTVVARETQRYGLDRLNALPEAAAYAPAAVAASPRPPSSSGGIIEID